MYHQWHIYRYLDFSALLQFVGGNPARLQPGQNIRLCLQLELKAICVISLLNRKIIKGTENFFGLGDCDEQHDHLQRKWTQRRKRHYHKRYGLLFDAHAEDAVDNFPQSGKRGTIGTGSISSYQSSHPPDPDLVRTMSRRESVATMAWKKMKKIKNDPGVPF